MFVENFAHKRRQIERILAEPPAALPATFNHVVRRVLERREELLACATRHASPFYMFDRSSLDKALADFRTAFDRHVPRHRAFFAVKTNHYPAVVAAAVSAGFGLDVSSGRELRQALATGAERILFSGPAKSADDLDLAVRHADRVTVNLDSFREMRLLSQVAIGLGKMAPAGVRINTAEHGVWSKFGIPLGELASLWREAQRLGGIDMQGIQSHSSWSHDAGPYVAIIDRVADYLRDQFTPAERQAVRYFDFGGGYRPHQLEGRNPTGLPLGELIKVADDHFGEQSRFASPYYAYDSVPLEEYTRGIGAAATERLAPLVNCELFSEPGRIVATMAMHLVLRVVDKKQPGLVIVDGGIHMVGWERYLHVYAPIVNLTRPALSEIPVAICGSLCDPEDLFGQSCFAESIEEGDLLLIPFQGAYTYVTAQSFIRDVPPVYPLAAE